MSHLRCTLKTSLIVTALLLTVTMLSGCASHSRDPAAFSEESPTTAYTRLGMAYLQRDDLERAQQAFIRAIDLSANDPDALQGLALIYQRQGEPASADQYFQRALSARSPFTQARNNYAAFLFSQNRIPQACEQLEQATTDLLYERRAQLFANLGRCRQRQGESDTALAAYQRALQLEERLPRAWLGLAQIQYQQHQMNAARDALDHYVQLAGHTDESLQLSRQLSDGASHDG
ncbi:type IV pilus biogenesis/stability protein PilW [Kushneria marisflavi]|uniref:Type IV pilus biogenesis/stability protein PilW n=1 Tax=Kushneria marisflavi TaxID=157779 RepID=A0A240UN61_9GAMM|nr:type IV pilus biogenesis/stability protein PilW [Kushneria marisflavi]ART62460.1 type IV pilus biogenesis/stability protein PilW [Kushneria marisflavi]RKD87584.1 type IV pilus assembly protein PilF [Kushneria marisflavi]